MTSCRDWHAQVPMKLLPLSFVSLPARTSGNPVVRRPSSLTARCWRSSGHRTPSKTLRPATSRLTSWPAISLSSAPVTPNRLGTRNSRRIDAAWPVTVPRSTTIPHTRGRSRTQSGRSWGTTRRAPVGVRSSSSGLLATWTGPTARPGQTGSPPCKRSAAHGGASPGHGLRLVGPERPGLDDKEFTVLVDGPFDVLRAAESSARCSRPASASRRTSSSVIAARSLFLGPLRESGDATALPAHQALRLTGDAALQDARRLAARHDELVGARYTGGHLRAKPPDGRDEKHRRLRVFRPTGKENTRGPGAYHALHQHGHRRIHLGKPRRPPVEDGPRGESTDDDPLPGLRHPRFRHIEERLELAGEGQLAVLACCAGPHCDALPRRDARGAVCSADRLLHGRRHLRLPDQALRHLAAAAEVVGRVEARGREDGAQLAGEPFRLQQLSIGLGRHHEGLGHAHLEIAIEACQVHGFAAHLVGGLRADLLPTGE